MRSRAISCVGSWVMSRAGEGDAAPRARGLPKIVIISVDLPAPLAPISVTISPWWTVDVDAPQRPDVAVIGLDASYVEHRLSDHYFSPPRVVFTQQLRLADPFFAGDAPVEFEIDFRGAISAAFHAAICSK